MVAPGIASPGSRVVSLRASILKVAVDDPAAKVIRPFAVELPASLRK